MRAAAVEGGRVQAAVSTETRALKVMTKQVCATLRAAVAQRLGLPAAAGPASAGLAALATDASASSSDDGGSPTPGGAGVPALVSIDVSGAITARTLDGDGLVPALCLGLSRDVADGMQAEDYVASPKGLQNHGMYSKAGWLACLGSCAPIPRPGALIAACAVVEQVASFVCMGRAHAERDNAT